jgi:hypothetical protein
VLANCLTYGGACTGYNPGYKPSAAPNDFSSTATSGAVWRPDVTSDDTHREQEAEREQRLEREVEERRQRAAALAGPEASADAQAGTASLDERAAFSERLRDELASLDADVDDLRSRAAMAGGTTRGRIDGLLKNVAPKRAQLEQAKKALDRATLDEWRRVRDQVQVLLEDTKLGVKSARDAL